MQLTGSQFSTEAALAGNDLATFPDFPAEIRAPTGTLYGVSGFQVNFSSRDVFTPGDRPSVLVAMNPAALKTNLRDLQVGGLLILDTGAFTPRALEKAGYATNPLEDHSLEGYSVLALDITAHTLTAVKSTGLSTREAARCKNFWTLGLMLWIYGRSLEKTEAWIEKKFAKSPDISSANRLALRSGYAYGENTEVAHFSYEVPPARVSPGTYRNINGNAAMALGLVTAAQLAKSELVLGSYPITPASDILHELSRYRHAGVTTVQAEDEIAAVCTAIGASYAGAIGVTTTSGPGLALKSEAIGLAVATELPLVVIDIQRGGPSTGLPTKTEQADLLQALHGRNGESPVCVLAAATPADCFAVALEAVRIATRSMTPVIVLSDGYLANGAEPWKIPEVSDLPDLTLHQRTDPQGFHPFLRDPETLARAWAVPGTPGLEHRIGGIEKHADTGNISYDALNHERMTHLRASKIARIAFDIPPATVELGEDQGELLVIGWGSTYGAIREAVTRCRAKGRQVSHLHLRHLNPLPRGLVELTAGFPRILVPELNGGQLASLLRATLGRPIVGHSKVQGQPFHITELEEKLLSLLEEKPS